MSRQPPFPRGLPQRPDRAYPSDQYQRYDGRDDRNDRYDRNYRDERNGRDDYNRPRSPPPPMYEFRGAPRYDNRPSHDDRRYPQRYEDRAPGTVNYDSYHPRDVPSNFSFRQEAPSNVDFRNADNYRRSPPRHRNRNDDNRASRYNFQRGRPGFRGRGGPRLASEREFLKGNRAPTPELLAGMDEDTGIIRFKAVEDLSDSDEADMDVSDDEDHAEQPKQKQARTGAGAADGDSKPEWAEPKWSNPDPYTALPPPDESHRKKKDMVKMIRKARVANEGVIKPDTAADDFISFNFDDNEDEDEEEEEYEPPPAAAAPSFTKNDTANSLQSRITIASNGLPSSNHQNIRNATEGSSGAIRIELGSNNRNPQESLHNGSTNGNQSRASASNDLKLEPPPISRKPASAKPMQPLQDSSNVLGSRKRNFRDEIKPAPRLHETQRGKKPPVSGAIVRQWKASIESNPTPWIEIDHSDTHNMGFWLHKEVMDFYHFVKPLKFEQTVRDKLVEDLNARISQQFPGAEIQTFGSFPAGLYLPTADMDVVMLSKAFRTNGSTIYGKSWLRKLEQFLKRSDMVLPGSLELILGARVPLVKYVDKLTGLKVDISFENNTGLVANETFQQYKALYPAMPMIVTVIKHLLAMRGLNEPVNGGIGGFSVICLVVSLLQHMPQVQSKNMIPEHHLGEVLMEFLNFYGNEFNTTTTGIQINPPGYFSKARANLPYKGELNKFMIIDPNNSNNDISGGSNNTKNIVKCFAESYKKLQQRMAELQHSPNRRKQSLLECILGGNYSSFKLQRDHLAHIHDKLIGDVSMEYA